MFKSPLSSSPAAVRRAFLAVALAVAAVASSVGAAAPARADGGGFSVPDAPAIREGSYPSDRSIRFFITVPASNGGSPIIDYLVEYKESTDSSWSTFSHTPSGSITEYIIQGLTFDHTYDVRVSAVNAIGTSAPSAPMSFVIDLWRYSTWSNKVTIQGCVNYSFCIDSGGAVEIPSTLGGNPVTAIDESAFDTKGVTSVTFPSTLTSIGRRAFYDNSLTSITLPSSLKTLGGRAFQNNQITSLTIPDSVTSLGAGSFASNRLTSVTIPRSVTLIEWDVFRWNKLTSVTIPDSVTFIGDNAFGDNALTSITIPNSVTDTGQGVFANNQLTSIVFGTGLKRIRPVTFSGNLLTSLTLPETVESMSDGAFSSNKLTSVTLPKSFKGFGYGSFANNQLTSIVIPAQVGGSNWYAFSGNLLTYVKFEGNYPDGNQRHNTGMFDNNPCLSVIYVNAGATGWEDTYQGRPVRISDGSNVSSTVPADLTSPTAVSAIAGVASAKVSFGAPVQTGGCSIASYKVTATNLSRPLAAAVAVTGSASPLTVSGLTNGDQYSFTVTATNGLGAQVTSASSNTVTPASLGTMTGTSLPNALQASWQALSSGNADHYVVETVSGDGTTCTSTETSCLVSELDNGVSQTLQISAYDDSGLLIFQTTFQPNSPKDAPDAPLQVSAVPGDASATISWKAPNNQGSAITSYTVTDSAGKTCQTSGTSCSITNLVPGVRDRFTVRATNSIGTSAPSDASEYITISATPLSPTGVSVVAGDKVLAVTWLASNPNRGSAISFYTVTDSQGHTCTGTPETLRCTLLDVTNNVSDVVTVTGTNSDGLTSVQSLAVTAVAGTVPSAPLNLVATSGWVSTTFTWSAPETDGGSPITSYVVTATDGALCTAVAPLMSCSILNLIGGSNQNFSVVAINSFGSSMASNEVSASAFDVPSRPTNANATLQNDGSIVVQWTAPSSNGSVITGYTVSSNFGDVCTAPGTQTSCTFSGLTKGNGYSFTVVASNGAGDSLSSAATSTVVDANVPDAPNNLVVDAGDQTALVSWAVPAENGSRILSYIVTASTGQSCETDQTSCLIVNLTNGTSVTFTVVAINGAGPSAPSGASPAVTPAGAPSAPDHFEVVSALHGSISLRWDTASGNGSSVIGYVVSDAQGRAVCSVTATSCIITGLINGTTYTYAVRSYSSVGESDKSVAISARPITVPTTPSQVSATAGASSVTIRFSQPVDDGGSIVTGYTVTDKNGSVCSVSAATSCRFTGLANGVVDTFSVTASNAAGTSVAAVVSATPLSAPNAPENVKAIALNGSALVSWDAAFANGSPISSYIVNTSDAKGCLAKGTTSCLVSGLTNGTAYSFTVKAFNAVGVSNLSVASAAVTPATSPSAPRGLVATVGDKFVTFSWSTPARNGGSAVVGYSVSSLNGENCRTTIELTCTITNLTNGQSYEFVATAQNAAGISAPSKAVSVVPIAVPSTPKITAIVPVARGLKVSFNGPVDTGGSPITRYQVSTNGGLNWQTANLSSVNARNFDVGSLSGGTTYGLTIRAFNAAGVSSASDVVYALYIATPGAPSLTSAVVSGTTVKVQYKAPTVTGGQAPSMYQYSLDGGVTWRVRPAGKSTEFMLTNLPKSTTLKLCIRAVNSGGYGTSSKILTLRVK